SGLGPRLRGRRVSGIWGSGLPLHLARPVDLEALRAVSVGRTLAGARRVGKYILIETELGAGVGIHLGMTGRLRVQPAAAPRATGRGFTRPRRGTARAAGRPRCWRAFATRWRRGSRAAEPRCAITSTPTAFRATTRAHCWSMGARGCPAAVAARRCAGAWTRA